MIQNQNRKKKQYLNYLNGREFKIKSLLIGLLDISINALLKGLIRSVFVRIMIIMRIAPVLKLFC